MESILVLIVFILVGIYAIVGEFKSSKGVEEQKIINGCYEMKSVLIREKKWLKSLLEDITENEAPELLREIESRIEDINRVVE